MLGPISRILLRHHVSGNDLAHRRFHPFPSRFPDRRAFSMIRHRRFMRGSRDLDCIKRHIDMEETAPPYVWLRPVLVAVSIMLKRGLGCEAKLPSFCKGRKGSRNAPAASKLVRERFVAQSATRIPGVRLLKAISFTSFRRSATA